MTLISPWDYIRMQPLSGHGVSNFSGLEEASCCKFYKEMIEEDSFPIDPPDMNEPRF